MRMPPLLADFTLARPCKPFCEKFLTLPKEKTSLFYTGVGVRSGFSDMKKRLKAEHSRRMLIPSTVVHMVDVNGLEPLTLRTSSGKL